jgi:DNA-directed RNA polymerase specialized sigma24 family protein
MTEIIEYSSTSTSAEISREQFFADLYERVFPAVARFIRKQHGSADDAKDIFHDALIIRFEKKLSSAVEITVTDEAYVFGIVKHLWLRKSKDNKNIVFTEEESILSIPDDFNKTPNTNVIIDFLKASGEKCLQLLHAFYYEKQSLDRIKASFGFASVRSATVQKFKCLEKVREVVKNKSKHYEDFFE